MRGVSIFTVATALGMVAVALGTACGGGAFSSDGDDGSAAEAGVDAFQDDVTQNDSPGQSDAPGQPDVLEEPPPSCTGAFTCVPVVPSGWTGPVELYSGTAPVSPCGTSFASPLDTNEMPSVQSATCGCQCGAAQVSCSTSAVSFYPDTSCLAASCAQVVVNPGSCQKVDVTNKCTGGVTGLGISAPGSTASGSCPAQALKMVPPVVWATNARSCASTIAPARVDCSAGSVCAPRPAAPYSTSLCVASAGDVPCPGAGYTVRHRFFAGVLDTRTCTPCTCGDLTNATCTASLEAYSSKDGTCSAGGVIFGEPLKCGVAGQQTDFTLSVTPGGGSCAPTMSSATGTVLPDKPTTYCCTP